METSKSRGEDGLESAVRFAKAIGARGFSINSKSRNESRLLRERKRRKAFEATRQSSPQGRGIDSSERNPRKRVEATRNPKPNAIGKRAPFGVGNGRKAANEKRRAEIVLGGEQR
jgi:hypothetical protein